MLFSLFIASSLSFNRYEINHIENPNCEKYSGAVVITKNTDSKIVVNGNVIDSFTEKYFQECDKIGEVTITGVDVPAYAFYNSSITKLTINKPTTTGTLEIGEGAFAFCDKLNDVILENGAIATIDNGAFFHSKQFGTATKTYTFSDLTTIGNYAFEEIDLKGSTFKFDKAVTIGEYAFYKSTTIGSVGFNTYAYEIKKYAFAGSAVKISGDTLKALTIGERAFAECTNFNPGISIECNKIGNRAFNKTKSGGNAIKINSLSNYNTNNRIEIDEYAFAGNTISGNINFVYNTNGRYSYITISDYAFYNCKFEKESINIKGFYTDRATIKQFAFYECSFPTGAQFTITLDILTIEGHAFEAITGNVVIKTGEDDQLVVGPYAFKGSSIKNDGTLYFNSGILEKAFYGCKGLTGPVIIKCPIDPYAFANTGLKGSIKIIMDKDNTYQDDQLAIGTSAFEGLTGEISELKIISTKTPGSIIISDKAFYNSGLKCPLVLHSTVTSIGEYAFARCTKIQENQVTIYSNTIKPHAFAECGSLGKIKIFSKTISFHSFDETKLGEVTINQDDVSTSTPPTHPGKTKIKSQAFYDITFTKKLTINSNTEIESQAFEMCTFSDDITIGDLPSEIGAFAFANSKVTKTISISIGNTGIGEHAFEGFAKENVNYGFNLNFLGTVDSSCAICKYAFNESNIRGDLVIPRCYNLIGDGAFLKCTKISKLFINFGNNPSTDVSSSDSYKTTSSIGNQAFLGCTSISSLILTSGGAMTSIGDYAFESLNFNNEITMPDSVTYIGPYAFSNCQNLRSVVFLPGSGLKTIKYNAFQDCKNMGGELYIHTNVKTIESYAFDGCQNLDYLILTLEGSLTTIGVAAFRSCGFKSQLDIPYKVNSIGNEAFKGCSNLGHHLTIKSDGTGTPIGISIGDSAFEGCKNLKRIAQVDYVNRPINEIGENAFQNTGIENSELYISEKFTNIGDNAFGKNKIILTFGNNLILSNIGANAFQNCFITNSITFPGSLTKIGEEAFKDCTFKEEISFSPNAVTPARSLFIGEHAFDGAKLPNTINLKGRTITLTDYSFYNSKTNIKIDEISNENIPEYAFSKSKIQEISIKNTIKTIESHAFEDCTDLSSVTINTPRVRQPSSDTIYDPGTIVQINGRDFCVYDQLQPDDIPNPLPTPYPNNNQCPVHFGTAPPDPPVDPREYQLLINDYAFSGCTNLLTIDQDQPIYPRVTNVGNHAFANCNLLSIDFLVFKEIDNEILPQVGEYAFTGCSYLQVNEFSIGNYGKCAFENTGFTNLTIKGGTFGSNCFNKCSSLQNVIFEGGNVGAKICSGCNSLSSIQFKASNSLITIGRDAFNGLKGPAFSLKIEDKSNVVFGEYSFYDSTLTGALEFPTSVVNIKAYAFASCKNLNSYIKLYTNNVEDNAFSDSKFNGKLYLSSDVFRSGQSISFFDTKFKNAEGITSIVFENYKSLTRSSDNVIPAYAFRGINYPIDVLTIDETITVIGAYAFEGCQFNRIDFKNSERDQSTPLTIHEGAFANCIGLNTVVDFTNINLDAFPSKLFYGCVSLPSVIFPTSLTEIGSEAFYGCGNLSINLDYLDKVKVIGKRAFSNCQGLSGSLSLSKATKIGEYAFSDCTGLTELLSISSNTETFIEPFAFKGCTGFKDGKLFLIVNDEEEKTDANGNNYNYAPYYRYGYFLKIGNQAFEDTKFKDVYYIGRFQPDCDYDIGISNRKGIHTSSNYANKTFCNNPIHHSKLSGGAIAGIVIACVVVVAAIVVLVVFLVLRMKKGGNKSEDEVEMNNDP